MKKKYNSPEWQKALFVSNDVITQSGTLDPDESEEISPPTVETEVSVGNDVIIHYR